MRDIDWQILIVLNEKKSITQAAEALFITQSALSKRIRSMEQEWELEIIERSPQGISFTENGLYLVEKAYVMVDFMKEIHDHFEDNKKKKEQLTIGLPNAFARHYMSKLLREYEDNQGSLKIKTLTNSSDMIVKYLTDGTVDIGVVCGDYPYIGDKTVLYEEQLYLLLPKGVKIEEAERCPFIRSQLNPMGKLIVDQWWKNRFGSLPRDAYKVPYSDIAIDMVENGLGCSFLFGNKWKVDREKVDIMPVTDLSGRQVTRNVFMLVNGKCYQSEAIMEFISSVEKHFHVNQ